MISPLSANPATSTEFRAALVPWNVRCSPQDALIARSLSVSLSLSLSLLLSVCRSTMNDDTELHTG